MHKQAFETKELKAELERGLGLELKSLVRIGGGGAINIKAERTSDGLPFVVKCFTPDHADAYERLLRTLEIMEGVKTPLRLFVDKHPWRTAINAIYVKRVYSKTGGFRHMGLLKSLELVSIAKTADLFRQQIRPEGD